MSENIRPRLYLITPRALPASDGLSALSDALTGGDVASVLITAPDGEQSDDYIDDAVRIVQRAGVAAVVLNDTNAVEAYHGDGVHIDTGIDELKQAVRQFQPNRIVGAGGVSDRHDAMGFGEAGADYVFFGRLDLPEQPEPHRKTLQFTKWWAPMFEIPSVAMAGTDLVGITDLVTLGADFIAVRDAIWTHDTGPAAAVAQANTLIDAAMELV